MKNWIKPTIIILDCNSVKSGVYSYGAEKIIRCDGVPTTFAVKVIFPTKSCTSYGNETYNCAGIDTSNSVIYVFDTGAQQTVPEVCS